MTALRTVSALRMFRGETEIDVTGQMGLAADLTAQLVSVVLNGAVNIGDVVVVEVSGSITKDVVGAAIVGTDVVLMRTDSIWDMYQSTLGDAVLQATGKDSRAHQTQIRWFALGSTDIAQVAIYPLPEAVRGVRVWCDPALVLVFVADGSRSAIMPGLRQAQPLWERLRAHHAPPMRGREHPELVNAYPVPNRVAPLRDDEWRTLQRAITATVDEIGLDGILGVPGSPQRAVEQVLLARRELKRHQKRLTVLLDHSHGSIDGKVDGMVNGMLEAFPGQNESVVHLSAPHRHLRDGFNETRRDIDSLADTSSETAALISTATVGRLLDRSEANRVAGTALGLVLAFIAIVTTYTALASVPSGHPVDFFIRLAGWVGITAFGLAGLVFLFVKLSDRPSSSFRHRRTLILTASVVSGIIAPVAFALGVVLGSAFLVVLGVLTTLVALAGYASLNDFR